jgi:hemolysin activation/secretion protein
MILSNQAKLKLCLLFAALISLGNAAIFPSLLQAQVPLPPAGKSGVGQKALEQSRPESPPPQEELPSLSIDDSRTVIDPGAGPRFIVKKIKVEGNTLINDATLAPILEVGDGLEVTLGILQLMAQEITSLYSMEGYILTRAYVPEQEIENGVVTIQVVEGKLGKVEVEGNQIFKGEEILARLQPLQDDPALKESTLEKYLLGLNAIQGLKVEAVLKPGEVFGTSDLTLQADEFRTYRVAFDADNFGSRFTGKERYGLTGQFGSLLSLGDSLYIRGVKSDQDQVYLNPSYTIPVGPYGTAITLSYTYSEFNLGGSLSALNGGGEANIFTVDLNHTLVRTRSSELYLILGGAIRNFKDGQLGTLTSEDELSNIYLTAGGFFKDPLRARTFYTLGLQQGLSETDITDPLNSRFLGRGDAFIPSFYFSRFQSTFVGNTYLTIKTGGQVASKRVLAPDLFAIGGFGSVRGYPLAEAAGDNGFYVSTELVIPFPFKVTLTQTPSRVQLEKVLSFFAFLDHGQVHIKNPQPGENDRELSGVGLGFRLYVPPVGRNYPSVSFALAYGFPAFGGRDPSDGSSNTLYLNGMISF